MTDSRLISFAFGHEFYSLISNESYHSAWKSVKLLPVISEENSEDEDSSCYSESSEEEWNDGPGTIPRQILWWYFDAVVEFAIGGKTWWTGHARIVEDITILAAWDATPAALILIPQFRSFKIDQLIQLYPSWKIYLQVNFSPDCKCSIWK